MGNGNRSSTGWVVSGAALLLGLLTFQSGETAPASPVGSAAVTETKGRPVAAAQQWLDADGQPLPFQSDEAITEFLRTAKVVSRQRVGVGINGIFKLLLKKDGVRLHAAFRTVRVQKHQTRVKGTLKLHFRDDAIFEVAAYRLSKLLGLNAVPPAVPRRINRKNGSLQIWVERAMTEKTRRDQKLTPPDYVRWRDQHHMMDLFDYLIANDDRNQGNILFDSAWRMWLIDHTQAFRLGAMRPGINVCSRPVFLKLQTLTDETLLAELQDYLSDLQVQALVKRRRLLVEHLRRRIESVGEVRTLFDREDW